MATITDAPALQSIAARQDVHVIVQTLTWEHTTFTTHVTLSTGQPTDSTAVVAEAHESSGGLTNAQVGAIVGSLVGFFVLAMIVICCCRRAPPPPPRRHGDRRSYGSYSSSYFTDDVPEPWPPKGQYRRTPKPQTPRMMPPAQPMPMPMPMPPQFMPPMSPRSTRSHRSFVQRPPPVVERIPGGPKFPTYRAIPIPNPRRPTVPHVP